MELGRGFEHIISTYKNALGMNGWVGYMNAQFTKAAMGNSNRGLEDAFGSSEINNVTNFGMIIERLKLDTGGYDIRGVFDVVKNTLGPTGKIKVIYDGERFKYGEPK